MSKHHDNKEEREKRMGRREKGGKVVQELLYRILEERSGIIKETENTREAVTLSALYISSV